MMALAELLEPFDHDLAFDLHGRSLGGVRVTGISDDSRNLEPGDVFVAVAGAASDGHSFVEAAIARGAVAVLAERQVEAGSNVPVLIVKDLDVNRGALAARLYGDPSRTMRCVGVTGTNGKTSIACFIADMLGSLGQRAGYLGTIGWGLSGALEPAALTTESAIILQKRLTVLRDLGADWAVMEVSSHALDQRRVDAVDFRYAVFSNLTRDHLDYHGTFENYGAAKARLFAFDGLRAAIVNVDDAFGRTLAGGLPASVEPVTVGSGEDELTDVPRPDVSWSDLVYTATGVEGRWQTPWGSSRFALPVFGSFSIANVSAALAVLCHAGFEFEAVVSAAGSVRGVPGRMEFFHTEPGVVVDYAHTPDALEKMLTALRLHVKGRLICVCGCGGDRDAGKRPLMGRIASEKADVVWLTSDNPRSESPQLIIDAMRHGATGAAQIFECVDRRAAIEQAVASAGHDDLVVIAGKGHETYQDIGGRRLSFSDRVIASELSSGLC